MIGSLDCVFSLSFTFCFRFQWNGSHECAILQMINIRRPLEDFFSFHFSLDFAISRFHIKCPLIPSAKQQSVSIFIQVHAKSHQIKCSTQHTFFGVELMGGILRVTKHSARQSQNSLNEIILQRCGMANIQALHSSFVVVLFWFRAGFFFNSINKLCTWANEMVTRFYFYYVVRCTVTF